MVLQGAPIDESSALDTAPPGPVERLREYLSENRFELNSRIPSERVLSTELGISRTLLRKALADLESEGQIWRHVGRGTFVGSRPIETASDVDYVSSRTSPRELMEARMLIEPGLARLAAIHATEADVRNIENCIRKTKTAPDWRIYETWDNNLHRAFALAAHNTPLMSLFDTLNMVRRSVVWARSRRVPLARKMDHHSFEEHDRILAHVANREPAKAEDAMRRHLETVANKLIASMEDRQQPD